MHFTRQAVDVRSNDKKPSNAPVIIAPIMLVATNSIARSITDNKIVPNIPVRSIVRSGHIHGALVSEHLIKDVETRITARYTTAIPNATHKNAGVTVITAVMRRKAVTTPIITAAATDNNGQFTSHLQLHIIYSPPITIYDFILV